MNIPSILEHSARKYPSRPALFWGWKSISYGKLDAVSNRWAGMLRQHGQVPRGGRVAILLKNSPEFVYAVFGVVKLGAVVVPINLFLKPDEIKHVLQDAGVWAVITTSDFLPSLPSGISGLRIVAIDSKDVQQALARASDEPAGVDIKPEEEAVIIYTSGTTGKSKGAVLTHANIYSNAEASVKTIDCSEKDRFLLILPMFHTFSFTVCVMMPLFIGASVIIVAGVQPFSRVMRNMLLRRATLFAAVPQVFQVMAVTKIPGWIRPFIRLRLCISGGAALPMATMQAFEKNTGLPLLEGYGLSETSPVVSINPLRALRKPGTVGLPIPGVSVAILDDAQKPVPPGQVGEIAVHGPNVMKGYWNNPSATAETIKNGWLLTGDMGLKDEDGYIKIVDRKKEMIIVRGMNVYPKEVEDVMTGHPAVAFAAVVGKLDAHRGEAPMAAVILKQGQQTSPKELLKYCQEKLADYKLPRKILFVTEFPRNATGKILKRELAKLF